MRDRFLGIICRGRSLVCLNLCSVHYCDSPWLGSDHAEMEGQSMTNDREIDYRFRTIKRRYDRYYASGDEASDAASSEGS